ncbi:MAG: hypothetical protein HY904_08325 [Deltaproteobacteria bacterium]|nr:hypothetical protein [Deltaproteobacteria bacterium]
MFRALQVRVACEGPTDTVIIRSALKAAGLDAVVTQIQPQAPNNLLGGQGVYGGGWKGVRGWCLNLAHSPGLVAALKLSDLLIVHVDADIAADREIQCEGDCPPAAGTCDCVRGKVLDWLGVTRAPPRLVLCVPSKATEAWVFCALFPGDQKARGIECRANPASLLVGRKPKLVRKKGSRYDKDEVAYEAALDRLAHGWKDVVALCSQGDRFLLELKGARESVPTHGGL